MPRNYTADLKKILNSLKREFFVYVFESWDCLADADIEELGERFHIRLALDPNTSAYNALLESNASRKKVIEIICEACQIHGLHKKDIADLDLLCTQLQPERKRWSVYEVMRDNDLNSEAIRNPESLCESFGAQLSMHIDNDVCMRVHNRAIWLRIGFKTRDNGFRRNNAVFVVFHPHAPYLITTPMKKKDQAAIFQALMDMLGADDIAESYLTGKHLASLESLTLCRHSQGAFSKYRLNQVDRNPLVKTRGRKRKGSVLDDFDIHTIDENVEERKHKEDLVDNTFGSNPQPKLQKLEYQMKTRLKGVDLAPTLDITRDPFHCTVQFEGHNVIEGIKQLSKAGLATLPLPSHLANVHSLAKNTFLLADKT